MSFPLLQQKPPLQYPLWSRACTLELAFGLRRIWSRTLKGAAVVMGYGLKNQCSQYQGPVQEHPAP